MEEPYRSRTISGGMNWAGTRITGRAKKSAASREAEIPLFIQQPLERPPTHLRETPIKPKPYRPLAGANLVFVAIEVALTLAVLPRAATGLTVLQASIAIRTARLGFIRQPEAGQRHAREAEAEFLQRRAACHGLGQTLG